VTGNDSQQQKEIARAIKNAREMALLPYANRVTTQRGGGRGRDRDGDGERGGRGPRRDESETELAATDVVATPVSSSDEPERVEAEVEA
jgi:hypothetical protein